MLQTSMDIPAHEILAYGTCRFHGLDVQALGAKCQPYSAAHPSVQPQHAAQESRGTKKKCITSQVHRAQMYNQAIKRTAGIHQDADRSSRWVDGAYGYGTDTENSSPARIGEGST
ncbi:hypothetical protein MKZ38_009244 [Zalerion maritima]|uniref:Uncharacterized protein n=1 Tax=Zalerion maritima TaxID=339359 RepID=A0AAD5WT29_9PEZI|nr:hypothetical protein MKZ38_009244 [Zalerion maritima]